ncbi:hypothetical protein [Mucilaginibacter sp.]|uniref:hypothetical protein n=1 Tax=Mucilaginibacter sp. TaxID=1882438 RepID=UPI002CEF18B4|nr:hypothetical protein [Mucilaginibacter sp.]HTI58221.1 hypothetical protein [Mucilaginibacter sp.]
MYSLVCVLSTLIFIVLAIAYVTARINLRANCDHYWEDKGGGDIKCAKCNKKFRSA